MKALLLLIALLTAGVLGTDRPPTVCHTDTLSERCFVKKCTDTFGVQSNEIDCGATTLSLGQREYEYVVEEACKYPGRDIVYMNILLFAHEVMSLCK